MSSMFRIGQFLKGYASKYTITKEIQDTVWFASNYAQELVVIKNVRDHPRVGNERDILKRFQQRTPYLRPLIDKINEPSVSTTIVLKHLQDDLLETSIAKTLNRWELKYVSRCVLEAIKTLYEDGFVNPDVKPDHVFVNLQEGDIRFSEATSGAVVRTPMWTSPEIILGIPWNTTAYIWSFSTMLISLIYGRRFNLFRLKGTNQDNEEYSCGVIENQFKFFAPYPAKIAETAHIGAVLAILYLVQTIPREKTTPLIRITEKEVTKRDNVFISKMMKLD